MAKKQRFEEFGVRYPDGQVVWEGHNSFIRIRNERERAEFVQERLRKLLDAGVKDDPGVVFLRRFRLITHTDAEIIS